MNEDVSNRAFAKAAAHIAIATSFKRGEVVAVTAGGAAKGDDLFIVMCGAAEDRFFNFNGTEKPSAKEKRIINEEIPELIRQSLIALAAENLVFMSYVSNQRPKEVAKLMATKADKLKVASVEFDEIGDIKIKGDAFTSRRFQQTRTGCFIFLCP